MLKLIVDGNDCIIKCWRRNKSWDLLFNKKNFYSSSLPDYLIYARLKKWDNFLKFIFLSQHFIIKSFASMINFNVLWQMSTELYGLLLSYCFMEISFLIPTPKFLAYFKAHCVSTSIKLPLKTSSSLSSSFLSWS